MDPQPSAVDAPGIRPGCDRCGADADFEIASLWLCINCYHEAGSTCAGIGRGPAPSDPTSTDQVC